MQVELSVGDMDRLIDWYLKAFEVETPAFLDDALYERLNLIHLDAKELESIDLNDCAGGACKL